MSDTRPTRPRKQHDEDDFVIITAPPRPLIAPGIYDARSTDASQVDLGRWGRSAIRLTFTIFDGPYENGIVLATGVNAFFNLGSGQRPPGASSRIVRLLQMVDPSGSTQVRSGALKNKLWKVQVETVDTDSNGKPLPLPCHYSRIADVLERLA